MAQIESQRRVCQQKTLLVIPVYNHGETLSSVVNRAKEVGWQVLVVDDGSDISINPNTIGCNVVRHTRNVGKGAAILTGIDFAKQHRYPYILTLDADDQHDPAQALKLLDKIDPKEPKLIIGARNMSHENVPGASIFGMHFSNFWVRLETSLSLPDTQSGMRLYPVMEMESLDFSTQRYDFEIESLVRLAWAGVTIESVDIEVTYPKAGERISHFCQLKDNARLTALHSKLVLRRLLPFKHKQLVKKEIPPSLLFHPVALLKQLLKEHTTPLQIATAVWIGIFLGAVPLIAVHTVAIIYTCHKLHLNKVAAVAASQLCMPPLVPLVCIQTGYYLFNGTFLAEFSWATVVHQMGSRLFEYLVGSLIIGPLLGFIVAGICYAGATQLKKLQKQPCP